VLCIPALVFRSNSENYEPTFACAWCRCSDAACAAARSLAGLLQRGHLNRKHSIDLLEDLDLNFLNMNGTQKNEVRVRCPQPSSSVF
jgi:hypothetical protein